MQDIFELNRSLFSKKGMVCISIIMKCLQCNENLTTRTTTRKFCSRSCSASYNNKVSPKKKRVVKACINCNKKTYFVKGTKCGKYCSNKCQQEYQFNTITVPRIELGNCKDNCTLRRYLSLVRGYKCECCELVEWKEKSISLHVDHINGNSDNNLPSNLRLLCPNCHSQTETFCGRNKKNTNRSKYNQRYRLRHLS